MKFKLFIACTIIFFIVPNALTQEQERQHQEKFLQNHPYNNRKHISEEEIRQMPKQDRPDLAWEQDFMNTMDPATKKPEPSRLIPIFKLTQVNSDLLSSPGQDLTSSWVERGPNNVGGRTRAVLWDPVNTNKVWAGGVSGGLWYNNDITNSTSPWIAIDDFWDNMAISCIALDPNNNQIMYVGTGEGYPAVTTGSKGAGIWKTTDGGLTWNQLSSTQDFDYVYNMVVRDESGQSVLYAGVGSRFYEGVSHGRNTEGMQRSSDGGISWNQVMPLINGAGICPVDLELDANNNLWVGTRINANREGGGRIYRSANGLDYTLVRQHPNLLPSSTDRVEIACAPSNANVVYAIFENGFVVDDLFSTTDGGTTWNSRTEPSDQDSRTPTTDFSRGQAWYDLTLDVDPNDENIVIAGAISLFKSTDGMTSWTQLSNWNNTLPQLQIVHSDQHLIKYKSGSSSEIIFGNDGGVYYSNNGTEAIPQINPRNNGYNVTQYYSCAIHPDAASNIFLAGSQDNGTQRYTSPGINATSRATGGDGGYCHIDQTNPNFQFTATTQNNIFISTDNGVSFSRATRDDATGSFINPSILDNIQNILFTYRTENSLYRFTNTEGAFTQGAMLSFSEDLGIVTHLNISPYTTESSTLYIGTNAGRLWRVENANDLTNESITLTQITGDDFPPGSISSIAFGASNDELLVTFYNYGVVSVWYTLDGGLTWIDKEGDLPDMPVRSALFNPTNYEEVILATEVGIWSTNNLSDASPKWTSSNTGLANVRVDMLKIRESDNEVIAATHGRGLFSSDGFNEFSANFSANSTSPLASETVSFTDLTTRNPTSWEWIISPSSHTFLGGTTLNSRNPRIKFNEGTCYSITLNASNSIDNDTETKNEYICIDYCASNFTRAGSEFISNVSLTNTNDLSAEEAINNTSGDEPTNGYGDYISQSRTVFLDSTYQLNVTINTSGNFEDHCWAYFDWNNDVDFEDPGEAYDLGDITNVTAGVLSQNIVIPANAAKKNTRMRIVIHYSSDPGGACNNNHTSQYGETEDYSIIITEPSFISWTPPVDITIQCDESALPENTGDPSASTNCPSDGINVTYTDVNTMGICVNSSVIKRNWTATDACGNNIEAYIQTINIKDTKTPLINCPDEQELIAINGKDAPLIDYTSLAVTSDGCSSQDNIILTQSPAAGSIQPLGNLTVTLTAADECGNSTECSFNVVVINSSAISWTPPIDIIIECDESILPDNTGDPSASTNCLSNGINVTYTDVNTEGICVNSSVIKRSWTATDACGNTETNIQTINIEDTERPILVCSKLTDELISDSGVDLLLPDYTSTVSATDNCTSIITVVQTPLSGSTVPSGETNLVTLSATDDCGNMETCTIKINGLDELNSKETYAHSFLQIYPNPSQGQFYLAVELNTIEYLAFEIIDKLGRVVLKSTSNNPEEPILLDLMNEPTGVYFIRILVDGQFINKRIVKT